MRRDMKRRGQLPIAAVDARSLVPVSDKIGGIVVYLDGKAAYYVLNGEWFEAVPEPPRVPPPPVLAYSCGL